MTQRFASPLRMRPLLCYATILLAVVVADLGCRKSSDQTIVKGRATYRGEPISRGAVTFFPSAGRPVTAPISEQGDYQAELAPGDYVVIVNQGFSPPPGFKEGDPLPPSKFTLPAEYSSRARSQLKAHVESGTSQPLDFFLK